MAWEPNAHTGYVWHDAPASDTAMTAAHLMAAQDDIIGYVQQNSRDYDTFAQETFVRPDSDAFITPTDPGLWQTGDIKVSACATPPTGWLLCNGAAVSRATYVNLFNAIGTVYGNGDGGVTFNLPDYRGRTIVGAGSGAGLTARAMGATGGSETHTHSVPSLSVPGQGVPALSVAGQGVSVSVPSHNHTLAAGGAAIATEFVNDGPVGGMSNAPTIKLWEAGGAATFDFSGWHAFWSSTATSNQAWEHLDIGPINVTRLVGTTDTQGAVTATGSTAGGSTGTGTTSGTNTGTSTTGASSSESPFAVANVFIKI